jgi:hypothetical protein
MLALDDAALARLAIGATRIRASERGRWLQNVARKLDPPKRPLTRQGRWRQRQRNGGAIYRLTGPPDQSRGLRSCSRRGVAIAAELCWTISGRTFARPT